MPIPGNFLSAVTEQVDPNTSGWTPLLNCTISLGSGGRNGPGVLVMKNTASGEMRARTVTSYPVSPGVLYETFADASCASTPERIGIRWLDSSNAELSITWGLVTATASSTFHRISVGGTAPAGAARAQVLLSSAPSSAGVSAILENAYLGFPVRTTGNLLPWNSESPEVDLSGWVVDANCAVIRQAPNVSWPVDFYLGGGQVVALTTTANGNASARTATPEPASPGVEYVAFCHLNPPTTTAATWVEIRFVDSAGSVLLTQRSQLAAPSVGWFRQIASATSPAGTVGVVVAFGITGGTSGQVVRADNFVVADNVTAEATGLVGTGLPSDSIVPFSDATFEQGIGDWGVVSGPATLARSTPWGATAYSANYSLLVSSPSAATSLIASPIYPLTGPPDQSWGSSYVMQVRAGTWTLSRGFHWYDADGHSLVSDASSTETVPSPDWWALTAGDTAPAGAAGVSIEMTLHGTAGAILAVDQVSLRQAAENAAASVNAGSASVSVALRGMTESATVSIWRITADGTRTLVRGSSGLYDNVPATSDSYIFEDYEAPLGVPVYYYAEVRDDDGVIRSTRTTTAVTVPYDDINHGWLKDPGNPTRNMKILIVGDPPSFDRPIDQSAYTVKNRRNKVTYSGIRNGNEGTLTVATPTDNDRAGIGRLVDSGNILLLQTAPNAGIGNMYVSVAQSSEGRGGQDADDPWRTWTLPLVESDMPATVGVNGTSGRTWQDVLSTFATWQDVLDAYATWEDVLLDNRRK